jgi:hypothetical protein
MAGIFVSCFQAWQDQYIENEAARSAGSIRLDSLQSFLYKHENTDKGEIEIALVLSNLQSRLVEYNVDSFELTLDSAPAKLSFVSRGGYVYASSPTIFRSGGVPISDTSKSRFTGTLDYAISYHTVGSRIIHHSNKSLTFNVYPQSPAGVQFLTKREHED